MNVGGSSFLCRAATLCSRLPDGRLAEFARNCHDERLMLCDSYLPVRSSSLSQVRHRFFSKRENTSSNVHRRCSISSTNSTSLASFIFQWTCAKKSSLRSCCSGISRLVAYRTAAGCECTAKCKPITSVQNLGSTFHGSTKPRQRAIHRRFFVIFFASWLSQ